MGEKAVSFNDLFAAAFSRCVLLSRKRGECFLQRLQHCHSHNLKTYFNTYDRNQKIYFYLTYPVDTYAQSLPYKKNVSLQFDRSLSFSIATCGICLLTHKDMGFLTG